MKGIILEKPEQFNVSDFDSPREPQTDEAMVQVERVGICGTDFHAFQGNQTFFQYPRVLGHELGVRVLAVGDGATEISAGDLCSVEPYLNCGTCSSCSRHKPNCCMNLKVLGVHVDGGMCGHLLVPIAKLHKSEHLSLDELALVETLSVGGHAVARAGLDPGQTTLVIGAGPIGLSVIASILPAGVRVVVMEVSSKRRKFCRKVMGIEDCIAPDQQSAGQLQAILSGDLPGTVFDCTGNPQSMEASFELVAHGGKLVFVGHYPGDVTFHDPTFHGRELTLLGSRNATAVDFRRIIELMEKREVDVTPWITHRVSSEELIRAFPGWLDKESGVVKPMVEWQN